jgi:hypothetical protein
MRDAYDLGRRIFEGFDRGRAKINAERRELGRQRLALVKQLAEQDRERGLPERGRAGRIARGAHITERHARRLLDSLYCASDSRR